MGFGAKFLQGVRNKVTSVRKDANFSRIGHGAKAGVKIVRAGAGHYLLEKIPIYTWIPEYVPIWIVGDVVAGASVAMIMFPQAVMFSALAGLPVQVALTASWLPSIISTAMGTSRDMSVGPLFMPSVAVGGMITTLKSTDLPPVLIAAALSMCVGLWSLLAGILNLGFLFDSLSVPIVLGFTCGMAIVAYMGQFAALFGLTGVSPMLSQLTGQFIAKLPETNPVALGLGIGCLVFLVVAQKIEKRWGSRSEVLRMVLANRNLFILLLTPGIGYYVNMGRQEPLWLSVGPVKTELRFIEGLNFQLVQELFLASFTLWFGIAIEHVIVAKALARMRGYAIDPSQELVHLGVSNIANSFMGGSPVGGGDMSRASVNATSGVRSPLSGLFVAAIVGAGMSTLSGFIELLPLPAIAAVIIVAVIDVMPSPGEMSKYWKWSFTDWATFLITFNTTLVVTPEAGLQIGGGILAVYTLFRAITSRPRPVSSTDLESQYGNLLLLSERPSEVSPGVWVMRLENDLMCANAERVRRRIVEKTMTMHSPVASARDRKSFNRAWNDCREKRVQYLRRRAGIELDESALPRLRTLVLDMTSVSFIDSSGLHAIEDIKTQLRSYGGPRVDFRFVALSDGVQRRFNRAAWPLISPYDINHERAPGDVEAPPDFVFDHLPLAIQWRQKDDDPWVLGPLDWEKDEKDNASIIKVEQWPSAVSRDMIY